MKAIWVVDKKIGSKDFQWIMYGELSFFFSCLDSQPLTLNFGFQIWQPHKKNTKQFQGYVMIFVSQNAVFVHSYLYLSKLYPIHTPPPQLITTYMLLPRISLSSTLSLGYLFHGCYVHQIKLVLMMGKEQREARKSYTSRPGKPLAVLC